MEVIKLLVLMSNFTTYSNFSNLSAVPNRKLRITEIPTSKSATWSIRVTAPTTFKNRQVKLNSIGLAMIHLVFPAHNRISKSKEAKSAPDPYLLTWIKMKNLDNRSQHSLIFDRLCSQISGKITRRKWWWILGSLHTSTQARILQIMLHHIAYLKPGLLLVLKIKLTSRMNPVIISMRLPVPSWISRRREKAPTAQIWATPNCLQMSTSAVKVKFKIKNAKIVAHADQSQTLTVSSSLCRTSCPIFWTNTTAIQIATVVCSKQINKLSNSLQVIMQHNPLWKLITNLLREPTNLCNTLLPSHNCLTSSTVTTPLTQSKCLPTVSLNLRSRLKLASHPATPTRPIKTHGSQCLTSAAWNTVISSRLLMVTASGAEKSLHSWKCASSNTLRRTCASYSPSITRNSKQSRRMCPSTLMSAVLHSTTHFWIVMRSSSIQI